jgi:hypothetical protein
MNWQWAIMGVRENGREGESRARHCVQLLGGVLGLPVRVK